MSGDIPDRFDDPEVLERLLVFILAHGARIDDLDVTLSKIAPVDLDLLQVCIRRTCARIVAAAETRPPRRQDRLAA